MANSFDYLFRVILVGNSDTDKYGLVKRFCQLEDLTNPSKPLFLDAGFMTRSFDLDSKRVIMTFWDTAGSERFLTMAPLYFRGTHGIVVVYDVTNRSSFESVINYYKREIDSKKETHAVVMLVGNKCHEEKLRQVSIQEGRKAAEEYGFLFFEASSETGKNVEPAFITLAQTMKENV